MPNAEQRPKLRKLESSSGKKRLTPSGEQRPKLRKLESSSGKKRPVRNGKERPKPRKLESLSAKPSSHLRDMRSTPKLGTESVIPA